MSLGEPFRASLPLKFVRGSKGRWGRFNLKSRVLFNLIGRRLELGRMYQIDGFVEGMGPFTISHVERGSKVVVISIPRKQAERLRYGSSYSLRVTSVREGPVLNIINTSYGPALKISLRILKTLAQFPKEDWGKRRKVVIEARLQKIRDNSPEVRCYAGYHLGSTDLCFWVGRKGLTPGDRVEIVGLGGYDIQDFVEDFAIYRGENFRNVLLSLQGDTLCLQVDGRVFPLDLPYLSAHALCVILHAVIGGTNKEIRFQFDGQRIRGCFFKDSPINSIAISGNVLELSYRRTEPRVFSLYMEKFGMSDLIGMVRVEPEPGEPHGEWRCIIDPALGRLVRSRLAATAGTARCSREKGDVSEVMLAHMIALTGEWSEVVLHPQSDSQVRDSHLGGPDVTARSKLSGLLFHFELKWWMYHRREALSDATRQARKYLAAFPTHMGEKVSGAMIGILDWDDREDNGRFHVRRVA